MKLMDMDYFYFKRLTPCFQSCEKSWISEYNWELENKLTMEFINTVVLSNKQVTICNFVKLQNTFGK